MRIRHGKSGPKRALVVVAVVVVVDVVINNNNHNTYIHQYLQFIDMYITYIYSILGCGGRLSTFTVIK